MRSHQWPRPAAGEPLPQMLPCHPTDSLFCDDWALISTREKLEGRVYYMDSICLFTIMQDILMIRPAATKV